MRPLGMVDKGLRSSSRNAPALHDIPKLPRRQDPAERPR